MRNVSIEVVTSLAAEAAGARLLVPALARFAPEARALAGLLPIVDINGALLAALDDVDLGGAEGVGREALVAGVFAADPFLHLGELAGRLLEAGIAQVANYPTLQHVDGAAGRGLAAVGYDMRAEFAVLLELERLGLRPLACVASFAAAECALGMGLGRLAFDPGPSGNAPSLRLERLASEAGAGLGMILAAGPSRQAISP